MFEIPDTVYSRPAFRPLLDLLQTVYLTTTEVAKRWRYSRHQLEGWRRAGKPPVYVQLPSGKVLYPLSEIIGAEIAGLKGPLTLDEVCLTVSACPSISEADRAKVIAHLRAALDTQRPRLRM